MAGRELHAALVLLDRQLVDRNGRLCGKVDDIELSEPDAEGHRYVSAILSGPGALLTRLGHARSGDWLRRQVAVVFPSDRDDPVRIPISRVTDIGNHITLSLDANEVATAAGERWVRDHIIGHLPGSDADAAG
jgi:sporulation protein YlmC with PRC-barrel domain